MIPPIPDLDLLAAGPFAVDQLAIVWHDDLPAPPAHVVRFLADRWAAHTAAAAAAGCELFNAPITQLRSFDCTSGTLTLHLAPADYRSFLISCCRDRPWFLQHAPDSLTPALGNSVLLTQNRHALLGLRSPRVAAYPGRAHLFGGVLEFLAPANRNPAALVAHLRRELAEELRLAAADLPGAPTLLALVRDTHLAQPELIWRWEIAPPAHLDLASLTARLDPAEHDSLLIHPLDAAATDLARLTPVARAALQLCPPSQREPLTTDN